MDLTFPSLIFMAWWLWIIRNPLPPLPSPRTLLGVNWQPIYYCLPPFYTYEDD